MTYFQVTYLWKFRGHPWDSTHGIVLFDRKFWARGCDEKQNKKNFTGSADSTVNLAGNSRGDASANVFSLRYANETNYQFLDDRMWTLSVLAVPARKIATSNHAQLVRPITWFCSDYLLYPVYCVCVSYWATSKSEHKNISYFLSQG